MPIYNYISRNKGQKKVTGILFALDENNLADKLAKSEQLLISSKIQEISKAKATVSLKPDKVLNLTLNLASFLKGGLPLVESLSALMQDTTDEKISSIVVSLKDYVEAGGSFKDALGLHPKTFSKAYTAIVASGERTGKLDDALEDVSNYLEWSLNLKAKIKELAAYPVIICIVMVGVVAVLVGWVLPKFEPMLAEMGTELPLPTKIVLGVSHALTGYWYIFLGGIVGFIVGVKLLLKNSRVAFYFDKFKLHMPIFGKLNYKLCLSRFSHLMDICTSSGISIGEALELGEDLIGNKPLAQGVAATRKGVLAGGELALGLKIAKVFPAFMVRMVGVGERSGDLAKGFNTVSRFYDKEIPRVIQKVFTILEPLLIVVMGVVVGGIALSVFLPLLKMTENVG